MKHFFPFSCLALCLLSTACNHVYYAPNTPNAPLLREKGESRITALYTAGADSEYGGGEVQLAHAIGNKTGLIASGFFGGHEEIVNTNQAGSDIEYGKGRYLEVGVGRFTELKKGSNWRAEMYAGLGSGNVNSRFSFGDFARTGFTKVFLQPAIAYRISRFEMAFVPRLNYVSWRVEDASITNSANADHLSEINAIRNNNSFFGFEPSLLVRGGNRQLKVQAALTLLNYNLGNNPSGEDLAENLNLSIGLSFNLFSKKSSNN